MNAVHWAPELQSAPAVTAPPAGWSEAGWFAAATADAGTNHVMAGELYVVASEHTPDVFIAGSKDRAMAMFREFEATMFDEAQREKVPSFRDIGARLVKRLSELDIEAYRLAETPSVGEVEVTTERINQRRAVFPIMSQGDAAVFISGQAQHPDYPFPEPFDGVTIDHGDEVGAAIEACAQFAAKGV